LHRLLYNYALDLLKFSLDVDIVSCILSHLYCLSDPLFHQLKSSGQAIGTDVQFGTLNKVSFIFSPHFFAFYTDDGFKVN